MSKDLITIDPKEYGMEATRAVAIAEAFQPVLSQMIDLEAEFSEFENLVGEPPKETCAAAKKLKSKYVSIRTSTATIHKEEKAAYLNAGRFVDAWKNRQAEISKTREEKLAEIADYHINLEKERLAKLREKRTAELTQYMEPDLIPGSVGVMEDDVYSAYLSSAKKQYDDRIATEKKAEEDRIAAEKAAAEEQKRIREENEKLRKEAEEREKQLAKEREAQEKKEAAERAERERIEAERQAAIDKERREAEAKLQKERAERERLEQIERERIEAEKAKQKALLIGSDSEKLSAYIFAIFAIQKPKLESEEAKEIAGYIYDALGKATTGLKKLEA